MNVDLDLKAANPLVDVLLGSTNTMALDFRDLGVDYATAVTTILAVMGRLNDAFRATNTPAVAQQMTTQIAAVYGQGA